MQNIIYKDAIALGKSTGDDRKFLAFPTPQQKGVINTADSWDLAIDLTNAFDDSAFDITGVVSAELGVALVDDPDTAAFILSTAFVVNASEISMTCPAGEIPEDYVKAPAIGGSAVIFIRLIDADSEMTLEQNVNIVDGDFKAGGNGGNPSNASNIIYTPAVGTDWVDPDPTRMNEGLDDAAARITVSEADIVAIEAKTNFIAVTQAVDLDAIETDAAASKVITDFIAVTQAVDLDTMESDTATNNGKTSNATHTGDVTGSVALTLASVAITGQTLVTADDLDHVLVADASDSDNLKKVLVSDFGGAISVAIYEDQKADGTPGGASVTGFQTRTLNTEVSDIDGLATLSANAITPIAGTYIFTARAPAFIGPSHQAFINDGTSDILEGITSYTGTSGSGNAVVSGVVIADGIKSYSVRHFTETAKSSNGLGVEADSGGGEVYTQLTIMRLGD